MTVYRTGNNAYTFQFWGMHGTGGPFNSAGYIHNWMMRPGRGNEVQLLDGDRVFWQWRQKLQDPERRSTVAFRYGEQAEPAAPVTINNTAEGGSDGTTATTGNTGGASGTAFDDVSIGAGADIEFDDDGFFIDSLSYAFLTGGAVSNYLAWTAPGGLGSSPIGSPGGYWRGYFYLDGVATTHSILRGLNGSTQLFLVRYNGTTKAINVLDSAGVGVAFGAVVVPHGQPVRLEVWFDTAPALGDMTVRLYLDPNAEVADFTEELVVVNEDLGGAAVDGLRFGNASAADPTTTIHVDNVGFTTVDWLGPLGTAPASPLWAAIAPPADPNLPTRETWDYDVNDFQSRYDDSYIPVLFPPAPGMTDAELQAAVQPPHQIDPLFEWAEDHTWWHGSSPVYGVEAILAPTVTRNNTFEGGSHLTPITTGNSGGGSGDAFNSVRGTVLFDQRQPAVDTLGMSIEFGSGSSFTDVIWNTPGQQLMFWRGYLYRTAEMRWHFAAPFSSSEMVLFAIGPTGVLEIRRGDGVTTHASGTVAVPFEQQVRVEWRLNWESNTRGDAQVRLYLDPNAAIGAFDEEVTFSFSGTLGGLPIAQVLSGFENPTAGPRTEFLDNIGLSTIGWLGPLGTVTTPQRERPSLTANAHVWDNLLFEEWTWDPTLYGQTYDGAIEAHIAGPPVIVTTTEEILAASQHFDDMPWNDGAWDPADYQSDSSHDITAWARSRKGLLLWLDASQYAGADGDFVSTWPNLSSPFPSALQSNGANQPRFRTGRLNGLPIMEFGGDDFMAAQLDFGPALPQPFTVFVIADTDTISGAYQNVLGGPDLSDRLEVVFSPATSFLGIYAGTGVVSGGPTWLNHYYLITGEFDPGGNDTIWQFGIQMGTGNAGSNAWGAFQIAATAGSSQALTGSIAEVRIYDRLLTTGERQAIEAELATKWFGTATALESAQHPGQVYFLPEYEDPAEAPLHDGIDAYVAGPPVAALTIEELQAAGNLIEQYAEVEPPDPMQFVAYDYAIEALIAGETEVGVFAAQPATDQVTFPTEDETWDYFNPAPDGALDVLTSTNHPAEHIASGDLNQDPRHLYEEDLHDFYTPVHDGTVEAYIAGPPQFITDEFIPGLYEVPQLDHSTALDAWDYWTPSPDGALEVYTAGEAEPIASYIAAMGLNQDPVWPQAEDVHDFFTPPTDGTAEYLAAQQAPVEIIAAASYVGPWEHYPLEEFFPDVVPDSAVEVIVTTVVTVAGIEVLIAGDFGQISEYPDIALELDYSWTPSMATFPFPLTIKGGATIIENTGTAMTVDYRLGPSAVASDDLGGRT